MPNWLKVVIGVVGLVLAAMIGIGFLLPQAWDVEREVVIEAPPEAIHRYVSDLSTWPDWAPWSSQRDATVTYAFGDTRRGAGASFRWESENMGAGRLEITRADPQAGVWYRLEVEGSADQAADGAFTYQPTPEGTRVVWRDQGRMSGFTGRYMVPMLERVMAEQFGQGLDRLKRQVESPPPASD